jgi:tRNA U34 2-thiouridine synthase MnmA/TrmU
VSKALVLLSGGLDSMATAALLSKSGHEVSGLFIDFGQPA